MDQISNNTGVTIIVRAKSVYGQSKIYPVNEAAKKLAAIAGTTTLTTQALRLAREMGCRIVLDGEQTILSALAA